MSDSPRPKQANPTLPEDSGNIDPIAFHDARASIWEMNYRTKAFLSRLKAFEGALGDGNLEGKRWLDAGCGTGTLARWLAARGANAEGIDGAPEMIRVANLAKRGLEYNDRLRFQVANLSSLPFPDSSFDGVLCSSVLEYTDDPESCLAEIARVTKTGGLLLISVPNAESMMRLGLRITFMLTNGIGIPRPRYLAHSKHEYTRAALSSLLSGKGFRCDYVAAFGSGYPAWLSSRFWFGPILLYRAAKP